MSQASKNKRRLKVRALAARIAKRGKTMSKRTVQDPQTRSVRVISVAKIGRVKK